MSHVWGGSMRFDSWSRGCCFFFSFALYVPRPQLQWCASTGCIERILFSSFLFVCIARFSKHIFAFPFNWRFLCFAVAFPSTACVCVFFFRFTFVLLSRPQLVATVPLSSWPESTRAAAISVVFMASKLGPALPCRTWCKTLIAFDKRTGHKS